VNPPPLYEAITEAEYARYIERSEDQVCPFSPTRAKFDILRMLQMYHQTNCYCCTMWHGVENIRNQKYALNY